MIHPEGQKKGWRETSSYPAMLLLIRSCKIKSHNNVPRSFCPGRLTGTRLDVALPLISILSSGGTGGLWPAQGRPLTWSSAASMPTLLWTDTVSKSRRTVLIAKNSESSWAQGKCAACKLDGFPISRARVWQEGYGQWKQLLQTANLPISLLITTAAHCAEWGIPIMVAQESLQVGLCLSLLILSMQRSGLLKFLNICLAKVPVCIF